MTAGQPAIAVHRHAAYRYAIRSEIALPGLPTAGGVENFEIRMEPLTETLDERSISWQEDPVPEARFDYPGLARFVVRGGRELTIATDPRADSTILPLYVQGIMLAAALYQSGRFVLHASVVDLGGYAIAFAGAVGAGKSTLATAFHAMGFRILADDNAALELQNDPPLVVPAFPILKVYPEIARSLGFEQSSLHPMHASQIKQAHSVQNAFSSCPLPLRRVYILDRDFDGPPARISPTGTITELIRHSVPTRWNVTGNPRHLKLCAQIAKTVPLYRVRTFRTLSEISGVADSIRQHAALSSRRRS